MSVLRVSGNFFRGRKFPGIITVAKILRNRGMGALVRVGPDEMAVMRPDDDTASIAQRREGLADSRHCSERVAHLSNMRRVTVDVCRSRDIGMVIGEIADRKKLYEVVVITGKSLTDDLITLSMNNNIIDRADCRLGSNSLIVPNMRASKLVEMVNFISEETCLGVRLPDKKLGRLIAESYGKKLFEMRMEWFGAVEINNENFVWFPLDPRIGFPPKGYYDSDPSITLYTGGIVVIRRKFQD